MVNISFLNNQSMCAVESSLYPDMENIRDQVTDLIVNRMQYPLHIVSIDQVRSMEGLMMMICFL